MIGTPVVAARFATANDSMKMLNPNEVMTVGPDAMVAPQWWPIVAKPIRAAIIAIQTSSVSGV
jgi:predicted FMN-binding regulatory protein PaiB